MVCLYFSVLLKGTQKGPDNEYDHHDGQPDLESRNILHPLKGSGIVEFDLAINRRYTTADGEKGEEVTFVPCKAFGRTGEIAMEYLVKGSPVVVEGRLRQESWQTEEGHKRSKLVVIAERLNLLPSRQHAGGEVSVEDADRLHHPEQPAETSDCQGSLGGKKH